MSPEPLAAAAALAAKSGVGLGRLPMPWRDVALALAAAALPADFECSEPHATAALRRWLAEEGAWLDVDPVELRRWLVDRGLWQRDGYGRAYQRTAARRLDAALAAVVAALDAQPDLKGWLQARRREAQDEREARRQAWQGGSVSA